MPSNMQLAAAASRHLTFILALLQVATLFGVSLAAANATTDSAQNATVNALVYGYPLTQFFTLAKLLGLVAGANRFYHTRTLSTAAQQVVVRPNEDTLYSAMTWDLGAGDLAIAYPQVSQDQYHLLTVYDPYGNILTSLGSGYTDIAGTYIIRKQPVGAALGLDTTSVPSPYKGYINSPTMYGVALLRLLVNATNLDALHRYQDASIASVIVASLNNSTIGTAALSAPPLQRIIQRFTANSSNALQPQNFTAQQQLQLTAALAPYCPPPYQSQTANVDAFLSAAGITNGTYVASDGTDIEAAAQIAASVINSALTAPGVIRNVSNQWAVLEGSYIAPNFGSNFAFRASIAMTGYLILPPPQTIYPFWSNISAGERPGYQSLGGSPLSLAAGEALIYDFVGGAPPLLAAGFWSLTMYDTRGFLIDNTKNTYRLGDRDNLTYGDGSLVYPRSGTNASQSTIKSFQILVQAADSPPPANWTKNWLPSPTGSGKGFTVLLRFYGGQSSIVNGQYSYPIVRRVRAISNTTSV